MQRRRLVMPRPHIACARYQTGTVSLSLAPHSGDERVHCFQLDVGDLLLAVERTSKSISQANIGKSGSV
jgi:hypothetical protein